MGNTCSMCGVEIDAYRQSCTLAIAGDKRLDPKETIISYVDLVLGCLLMCITNSGLPGILHFS